MTRPPARARRCRRYRSRHQGFTLVELMVAIMVLTVGILALAGTAAVVIRLMSGGARQTLAATVVRTRFERLRNRPCALVVSGHAITRHVEEQWTVSFPAPGMALVVDSVRFATLSGRTGRSIPPYRGYLPCAAP